MMTPPPTPMAKQNISVTTAGRISTSKELNSNPNPQTNYLGYDIRNNNHSQWQHDKIPPPPPHSKADPIAKPGLDKTQQEGYLSRLRGSLLLLVNKL